jgi:hypothetical protein
MGLPDITTSVQDQRASLIEFDKDFKRLSLKLSVFRVIDVILPRSS